MQTRPKLVEKHINIDQNLVESVRSSFYNIWPIHATFFEKFISKELNFFTSNYIYVSQLATNIFKGKQNIGNRSC